MKKDILTNARFGDKFVTRDGSLAIYLSESHHHQLAVEDDIWHFVQFYNSDGSVMDAIAEETSDIVDVYHDDVMDEIIDCLRLSYNSFNNISGIDVQPKVVKESSLSRRIREVLEKLQK